VSSVPRAHLRKHTEIGWPFLRADLAAYEDPQQDTRGAETFARFTKAGMAIAKDGVGGAGTAARVCPSTRCGRDSGTDIGVRVEDVARQGIGEEFMMGHRINTNASFDLSGCEVTHGTV